MRHTGRSTAVPCSLRLASSRGRRTPCGALWQSRWRVGWLPSLHVVSQLWGKDCTQSQACGLRWACSRDIVTMLVHFAARGDLGVLAAPSVGNALFVCSNLSTTLHSLGLVGGSCFWCFNGVISLKASCSPSTAFIYVYLAEYRATLSLSLTSLHYATWKGGSCLFWCTLGSR